METNSAIGERLRAEVEKRYKTQREFAEAMSKVAGKEVAEQNISDLMRGRSRPGKIILKRLADMDFDCSYILTGRRAQEKTTYLERGEKIVELRIPTNAEHILHDVSLEGGTIYIAVYAAIGREGNMDGEDSVEILAFRQPVNTRIELKAAATPIQN